MTDDHIMVIQGMNDGVTAMGKIGVIPPGAVRRRHQVPRHPGQYIYRSFGPGRTLVVLSVCGAFRRGLLRLRDACAKQERHDTLAPFRVAADKDAGPAHD